MNPFEAVIKNIATKKQTGNQPIFKYKTLTKPPKAKATKSQSPQPPKIVSRKLYPFYDQKLKAAGGAGEGAAPPRQCNLV